MFPYLHIFGRTVGTYGVCMVLGILLTGALSIKKYRSLGLPPEDIYIVGAFAVGAALVFGNLLYIAVSYPFSYILDCIKAGDLSFVGSGIVFYGGLIGGVAGAFLGASAARSRLDALLQSIVPYVPLGHAVGRIGCLMAGCCHGMTYDGPLAVHYSHSVLGLPPEQGYFPVQPLEAVINLIISGILIRVAKREKGKRILLPAYLSMYAVSRFTLEFFRGDLNRGIFSGLSLSQWISIGVLIVSITGILLANKKTVRTEDSTDGF